jgi:hypothetical protein
LTVQIGREEALALFDTWRTDRVLVRCDFRVSRFVAVLRARVIEAGADELRLLSDDAFSEVVVSLGTDIVWEYGDPRGFPEEAAEFERALVMSFPAPADRVEADRIIFLEIIEQPHH